MALALALPVGNAMAFDSAEWHGKRELFAREAERLMGVYTNCVSRLHEPAENVTLPIDSYSDGAVKVSISAGKAQYFLREGYVWGENIIILQFDPQGKVEARIDARNCVIDRKARNGWVPGAARLVQGKTSCLSSGVFFSAAESYVRAYGKTTIESSDMKMGGMIR